MPVLRVSTMVSEQYTEISKKLCSLGGILKNPSLMRQTKILDKLIYKYKNQHGKEKYFKCLEMIKKCIVKWKALSLDEKLIVGVKNICSDRNPASFWEELLIGLKHGGTLVLRNIVLCQKAVQYFMGFLQLGFFVTLHVTLFALVSRIWVLLKDYWAILVECYQLARTVCQTDSLTQFPECLTLLLKDELQNVYNTTSEHEKNPDSPLTKLVDQINDDEGVVNSVTVKDGDFDLGEPVRDIRRRCDDPASPKSSRQMVSNLLTKKLKFDNMELLDNDDDEMSVEKNPVKKVNEKTNGLIKQPSLCGVTDKSPSTSSRWARSFFNRKRHTRYSIRTLASTVTYCRLPVRKICGLLVIINHLLHSESAHVNRKILLRSQRNLQNKLTTLKRNKSSGLRKNKRLEICRVGETWKCVTTGVTTKTNKVKNLGGEVGENPPGEINDVTSMDVGYNEVSSVLKPILRTYQDSSSDTAEHLPYRKNSEPNEIDDIFSSLGF